MNHLPPHKLALVNRALNLARQKGLSSTRIADLALSNPHFFNRLSDGGGFTDNTHDRLKAWLDDQATETEPAA